MDFSSFLCFSISCIPGLRAGLKFVGTVVSLVSVSVTYCDFHPVPS